MSLIVLDMAAIAVCHSGSGLSCDTQLLVFACGVSGFSTVSRADLVDETAEDPDSDDMVGDGVLEYGWCELVGDAVSEYALRSWGANLCVDLSTCAYVTLAGLLEVGSC